jgi:phage terminase large subunit
MSIILCQRHLSEIRVIEYIEDDHKTLAHYSALLKKKDFNWGKVFLPHDGAMKDYKYDQSAQDIMQRLQWRVQIVPRLGIEEGIKVARQTFNRVYFDKEKASGLLRCLKNYKRRINTQTNEPGEPLHDEHSHGADAFRYMCTAAPQMWNETDDTTVLEPEVYPDS